MKPESLFFEKIETIAFNKDHRHLLDERITSNAQKVKQSKLFFSDLELARTRAAFLKSKSLDNLEKYLIEFESNFIKRGGKVIWAQDKEEAIAEIAKIIERKAVKSIVKSRSTIFEEIDLSKELGKQQIACQESDIGNLIQQIANESCYHPVFPTIHQEETKILELIIKKFPDLSSKKPQQLVEEMSKQIIQDIQQEDISISAVNFLVADSGATVILSNEATNAQLASFAKTQLFICGIEDIIPSLADLDLFVHLYSTHSNGSASCAYTHIISGPKQADETDGPDEMYVILLDNGRSNILEQVNQRSALACINCGACHNSCPVYKSIGGHAYQSVYTGPIGSITTPIRSEMSAYKYLSFASPSAMESVSECPVKINFPKLLQNNRTASVLSSPTGKTEKLSIFFWKAAMLKRSNMDKGGAKLKNFMLRQFFKRSWGERREMPVVAQKSFNQIWRERKGIK